MNLRGVILALVIGGWALPLMAAPTASFTAHRCEEGPALCPPPVYVHFDATASTSSIAGDKPFFDLLYEWDFGDVDSGRWGTDGLSKNRSIGGVAGHVFERPGTYVVRLTVTDRTGQRSTAQRKIVVTDPEAAWPSSVTACVSSSGEFSGCPSGAMHFTSSDSCVGMSAAQSSGSRRILFRRGDAFTSGPCSTSGAAGTLYGAYGDGSLPRPRFNLVGSQGGSPFRLNANDVRVMDLDIQDTGTPMFGVEAFGVRQDILLLRNRVQTRETANFFFATNGPDGGVYPLPSGARVTGVVYHLAMVDNDLRGSTSEAIGGGGTCFYGGAVANMFAGNRCGRGTAWQVRIIFNDRSVFQHNIIESNAGAFEAVKYHCAGGPGVLCRFNVFSDNVLVRERLNITGGSAEDGNTITDSVFERNWLPNSVMIMEQPGNLFRHNVVRAFRIAPRANFGHLSRGNTFINNTCNGGGSTPECVGINVGADGTGTVARNNLFYAGGFPGPSFAGSAGTGTVEQAGNQLVTGGASPFVSNAPTNLAGFALPLGSRFIDAGVETSFRSRDLIDQDFPSGSSPDVGAIEFQSGISVVDKTPPDPGRVDTVQVIR